MTGFKPCLDNMEHVDQYIESVEPWTRIFDANKARRRRLDMGLSKTELGILMRHGDCKPDVMVGRFESGYSVPKWDTVALLSSAMCCDLGDLTTSTEEVIQGRYKIDIRIDYTLYAAVDNAERYRFNTELLRIKKNVKRRHNEQQRTNNYRDGNRETTERWGEWSQTEETEEG